MFDYLQLFIKISPCQAIFPKKTERRAVKFSKATDAFAAMGYLTKEVF
jgi:hypothetical protein